jgi:acetylornithine deacetylase
MTPTEILRHLVAFPTVSSQGNLALLDWTEALLAPLAPRTRRFSSPDGTKANLLVSFGPDVPGGLVLSGHTDVVPVEGQAWLADPWTMREADGRLIGRGVTDMKGFLACCLAAAPALAGMGLRRPVHLALSYDEEVGCTGVGPMAEWIGTHLAPALAVIGEPSLLRVVNAHKGGLMGWAHVTGTPGHSSQPDRCVNAVMVAAECIVRVNAIRDSMRAGPLDPAFDPPWSTIQVNRIEGGEALNIVAAACRFFWEMRVLPGVDDRAVLAGLEQVVAAELVPDMLAVDPACGVRFDEMARIPALAACDMAMESRLLNLFGQNEALSVPYGSEAGIFQGAGIPSVIIGPGDIAQAHQPEEWLAREQLEACGPVLEKLVREFCC